MYSLLIGALLMAFLVPFLLQMILFFFVYKSKYKKYAGEVKITTQKTFVHTILVVIAMTIVNILSGIVLGKIINMGALGEMGATIVSLLPFVFALVGGYFVFKALLTKHGLLAVNAKKVADQTIVFFIVYGILLVFALMFLVTILASL